jgi:hypothetical protein
MPYLLFETFVGLFHSYKKLFFCPFFIVNTHKYSLSHASERLLQSNSAKNIPRFESFGKHKEYKVLRRNRYVFPPRALGKYFPKMRIRKWINSQPIQACPNTDVNTHSRRGCLSPPLREQTESGGALPNRNIEIMKDRARIGHIKEVWQETTAGILRKATRVSKDKCKRTFGGFPKKSIGETHDLRGTNLQVSDSGTG